MKITEILSKAVLTQSALSNQLYLAIPNKKKPYIMDHKVEYNESHFLGLLVEYLKYKTEDGKKMVEITSNGKPEFYIKLERPKNKV